MSDITVIILTKNEEKNIKASIISSKQRTYYCCRFRE